MYLFCRISPHARRAVLRTVGMGFVVLFVACPRLIFAQTDWDASAYKDWKVESVTIRGLDDKMAAELKAGLALALSSGFLGTKDPIFFPQTLEEDVRRTRLFLARRGYPYATVDPRFEPIPRSRRVDLVFDIDKGPAVRVASVSTTGIPSSLEKEAEKAISTEKDEVFRDGDLGQTVASLTTLLHRNGYARASVDSRVEWDDTTHVTLVFAAEPGAGYYFGDVIVTGADDDLVPVVKRTARIQKGRRYDPKVIEDAQKNLRILGLFRQIRLDLEDSGPDTLDVLVDLMMRESRRFETAVRYWTDEKLDVGARWTHRNLFKGGRGGSAVVSASTVLQRIEFTAWWPAVLAARSRATATIGIRRENEESYELAGYGAEIGLSYDFSLLSTIRVAAMWSNIAVTEKTEAVGVFAEQDGTLNALSLRWERNAGNDLFMPTRGTVTNFEMEWAPDGPLNDYRYIRVLPTGIVYAPVPHTTETSFAARLTVGLARPLGESEDLLPNKRFYSGGASSMRGFKRRKLGPKDSGGKELGGEAKIEASVELRFPLFWKLHGTAFVDAGQVWMTIDDASFNEIEVAVGPGLWIKTIVGPLRGDLAYRVTYFDKTQGRWRFHFSIGPAF